MNREEFEKLILRNKDGNFYPSFTIEDGEYILTNEYTAEEDYERWLKSKDNQQIDKTKISPTTDELKEENGRLWETVEFLLKQVNMIPKE